MDLRVALDYKMNVSQRCFLVAKQPNSMLGHFKGGVTFKSKKVILLYLALVMPNLEHCIQFGATCFKKVVDKFSSVKSNKNI